MSEQSSQGADDARAEQQREDDEEEVPETGAFELRREVAGLLFGTCDTGRLEREIARARAHRARMRPRPRTEADPGTDLRSEQEVVDAPEGVEVVGAEDPSRMPGFGATGRYVEVRAARSFAHATLRFTLDPKARAHLDPGTIIVARWDEGAERLRLVPQSGFDERQGYVYARIARPGLYTAIGIPSDPRVRSTLQLMDVMRGWDNANGDMGFLPKICGLILCDPELQARVEQFREEGGGLLGDLGFDPGDFDGGLGDVHGGTLCDVCLGGGGPDVRVDVDLAHIHDYPHVPIPWGSLHPVWPTGCGGWSAIGPTNVPGRITSLAINPTTPATVYAGAAAGGVFRTLNGGSSWTARWSEELSLAIGGLAVAPSDPRFVYAATGEWVGTAADPGNHFAGVGVYGSVDGGGDWNLLAPIPSKNTSAVAVDPTHPYRVYIAGDTSLHRSADGGQTWDVTTGNTYGIFDGVITDVVVDPTDGNRIYIGVHLSGVWQSTNGGTSWTQLTSGIGTGATAQNPKIALGRSGVHGAQFVAVKMGQNVYTSTNRGSSFTKQTDCGGTWTFFPWANVIAVDPTDESILLAGHDNLYRTLDGGTHWTQVGGYKMPPMHPDLQALAFDPSDRNHVYAATDGGVFESTDIGLTWAAKSDGLQTTQCWTVGVTLGKTLAYGITTQDNQCYKWAGGLAFTPIRANEGGYIEWVPEDAATIYADTWSANLQKSTDGGATWTDLGMDADPGTTEALRIARSDPKLLLLCVGSSVSRSTNGGTSWTTTLSTTATVTSVAFAPTDSLRAYAGSADGRVWHSTDSGATWTQLTTAGVLPAARIKDIEVDSNGERFYVGFGATQIRQLWRGDLGPGNTVIWHDVTGALPAVSLPDLALTGLALHPTLYETLYVSNILGVYRTVDGGESWHPFDEGLPNVFITDLDLRDVDLTLFAATMGRGLYKRDLT